jgi:hypothetical protein
MTGKRARRSAQAAHIDARPSDARPGDTRPNVPATFVAPEGGQQRSSRASAVRRAVRRSNDGGADAATAAMALAAELTASSAPVQGDPASTAFADETAVVRRTKDGWRVGSDTLPDLTCAMILADLLAAENGAAEALPAKPSASGDSTANETGRLRATVGQLEHALATRIRVEQAIGVLAERHRIKPRQAFEQLRDAARSRGRKVIDIAGDVVASATNPLLQLPDELSRPRSGPRRPARQQFGAQ